MRDPRKPYPTDHLLAYTVLKLIPRSVRPNQVTVLRMLLTPFVLWFIIIGEYRIGIPFFLLVALTDAIDGAMARLRNQITQWGTMWDPIADKLLIGSAIIVIVLQNVNLYLGSALILVELMILVGGYVKYKQGKVYPANKWGKAKMFVEVVAVACLMFALAFNVDLFMDLTQGTLAIAIVFAVMSMLTHSN